MRYAIHFLALGLFACLSLSPSTGETRAREQSRGAAEPLTPCDVEAYVIDKDPKGLNVRSGPGSTSRIVGNLPNQDVDGIGVHITGSSGEWVRIDHADEQGGDEERSFFKGEGWVYGPLLGVDGVGWISGGTKIYAEPSPKSRVVARMQAGADGAVVRGCKGKWVYVEYKKLKGWAERETLCTNALTTCS